MKYLILQCDNLGLECGFISSASYKKDNPLLKLNLNFQINFVLHLHGATWMKQLPTYTIGCKTQIALIFKNIFKAASLSCYLIVIVKII